MNRIYRTDDFKHNGQYNNLSTLRNSEGGTDKNEIISYIFGIIPSNTRGHSCINAYRIYHLDSSRLDVDYYAFLNKGTHSQFNGT